MKKLIASLTTLLPILLSAHAHADFQCESADQAVLLTLNTEAGEFPNQEVEAEALLIKNGETSYFAGSYRQNVTRTGTHHRVELSSLNQPDLELNFTIIEQWSDLDPLPCGRAGCDWSSILPPKTTPQPTVSVVYKINHLEIDGESYGLTCNKI